MNTTQIEKRFIFLALFAASSILCSSTAYAGGYEVSAHSAEGMAVSNAGAASGFSDGSALYFNPAAITALQSTTITVNGSLLSLGVKAKDQGSQSLLGQPIEADPTEGEITQAFVPSAYLVHPINERFSTGIFLVSPFGLGSEFDHDWAGRYQAIKSELTTVQTGAALAYRVTDAFSIGASMSSIYADATLSNAVDFGSIGVATLGLPTASALGLAPQQNDGFAELDGSDWAMGWSAGIAYSYGSENQNRLGLSYRASTGLDIHGGSVRFDVPNEALALTSTGAFADTGASASLTLPEAISFGATHWVSDSWAVLLESKWTRWPEFDELTIDFENSVQPDQNEKHGWKNTWRHGIGLRHVLSSDWTISGGFVYDQGPLRDDAYRTARIPESDQYWGSLGVKYKMTDNLSWHIAYQHVWVDDGYANHVGSGGDTLNTKFENGYDDIALGFVYSM